MLPGAFIGIGIQHQLRRGSLALKAEGSGRQVQSGNASNVYPSCACVQSLKSYRSCEGQWLQFLELMDVQGPWWWRLSVRLCIVNVVEPILKLAAKTNGNKICRGISFTQSLIVCLGGGAL